jgi:UDP-glucose 4-epimerase
MTITPSSAINAQTPVLVTGGAGFIASHLVEKLVEFGAPITVLDNISTGSVRNLQRVEESVKLVFGDLSDLLRLKLIDVADYRYIFHLAANPYIPPSVDNPPYDFHQNLYNTFSLLEALRTSANPPRLVNVSSAAVYGNPARLPIREGDPTVPISPYGVSKLAGERYAAVYSDLYGIRATSMRFFSVYGPRQRKQVVFDLLRKLYANPHEIEVYGDGSQARDFAYVLDVVQAMILAATQAPGHGEAYNVASGTTHSISQLLETWLEITGFTPQIKYTGSVRPGDAEKWEVDISQLQAIGYKPATSLKAGLEAVREWYDANFK